MMVNLLAALPFFAAFFWALILLIDKKKSISKSFLTGFFFLITLNYFAHWFFFTREYEWYAVFNHIWIFTSLGVFPLAYCYLRLLAKDSCFSWKLLGLIVLPFLFALYSVILYVTASPVDKNIFVFGILFQEQSLPTPLSPHLQQFLLRDQLFKVIFFIQAIVSFYFNYKILKDYDNMIKQYYSNVEGKDMRHAKKMLYLLIFITVVAIVSSALGKEFFIRNSSLLFLPSLLHFAFIFFFGYLGNKQSFTIDDFNREIEMEDEETNYVASHSLNEDKTSLKIALLELMEEDRVYLNHELKITDLANMLNTNRTYVSNLINDELGLSFSTFVNNFRIEHSKKLLLKSDCGGLTLSQVAEMSGFSNDSTYYRVFKAKEKVSPGMYKQLNSQI